MTNKIIDGLKDAIAGNVGRVTIDGQAWERVDLATRPVAWRVGNGAGGWIICQIEADAAYAAENYDVPIQGLYVRNGL